MADAPYMTGSELTANPGNAALGYSSGVEYGVNPAIQNPLSGIDSTLAKIQDEDARMRIERHREQQKEQEDVVKMLQETGGSLFNMRDEAGRNVSFTPLPQDKKILSEKADALRRMVINNPRDYQFNPEFHKAKQELDYYKTHAGQRALYRAKNLNEASSELIPSARQERLSHLEREIDGKSLEDFHTPEPYMRQQPLDVPFVEVKPVKRVMQGPKDAAGNYTQKTIEETPIEGFDQRAQYVQGTPYFEKVNNYYKSLANSQTFNDPREIIAINTDIVKKNQQLGLTPQDANFIEPVGIVDEQTGMVSINPDPYQTVRSLNVLKNYRASESSSFDKGRTQADIDRNKLKTQQKHYDDQANYWREQIKTAKKNADTARMKAEQKSPEEKAEAEFRISALNANSDLAETNSRYAKKAVVPVSKQGDPKAFEYFKNKGINTNDYLIANIPVGDKTVASIGAKPLIKAVAGKEKRLGIAKYDYAYYLRSKDGDSNKDLYMLVYPSSKPNGAGEVEVVTHEQAIGNIVDSKANLPEKFNDKDIKRKDYAINMYRERNATGRQSATQQDAPSSRGRIIATKVKNGKTYVQYENGDVTEQ